METVNIPEPAKPNVEKKHSPDEIKEALRGSFNRYKTAFDNGALDDKPELKWKYVGTRDALEKTLDRVPLRTTLDNEFHNHPADPEATYKQMEGIPVDGLLEFTQQEIDTLPDGPEKEELEKQYEILNDESRSYNYSPARMEPGRLVARVTQEASLISVDPILQPDIIAKLRHGLGRKPTQHEIVEANWYRGIDAITTRRELVIPAGARPPIAPPPGGGGPPDEPPVVDTPPVDTIDNLRIQGNLIGNTETYTQKAQAEAQKDVDKKMRAGKIWEIWRWPKKALIRMQQSYLVEHTRQKFLGLMAKNGTSYLTADTAGKTLAELTKQREQQQADTHNILRRFASGAVTSTENARGERIVEVTNATLRQKMVDQILKPIVESIKSGTPLTEEQVQENLRTFVKSNLKDHPELQEFFGPNNDFGELAQVFATDMTEIARQTAAAMDRFHKTLGELDNHIHFNIANAKGYNTEQRGLIAKWVAAARRRRSYREAGMIKEAGGRLGLILNPFVVGVSGSLALQGLTFLSKKGVIGVAAFAGLAGTPVTSLAIAAALGGVAGGLRRHSETGADVRRHMFERASSQNDKIEPKAKGIKAEIGVGLRAITGGSSREDLEKIRLNLKLTSAKQLLDGGATDIVSRSQQKSLSELLTSTDTAQIAQRIAEIDARERYGRTSSVDFITYTNKEQETADLGIGEHDLRQRLDQLMSSPQAAQAEIVRFEAQYAKVLIESKKLMDKALGSHNIRKDLIATGFGTATGAVGGYVGRGLISGISQLLQGHGDIPVIGAFAGAGAHAPTAENAAAMPLWEHAPVSAALNKDVLKELYQHPRNLPLPGGLVLAVDQGIDGTHHASILDQWGPAGRPLNLPPMNLTENGSLVVAGNPELIPENVHQVIAGWEVKGSNLPEYNLYNHIEEVVKSGQHEGFAHGNLEIDMNSGHDGQMSMRVLRELGKPDTGVHVHGFAHLDANGHPIIDIDHGSESNLPRTPKDWKLLHDEMKRNGWNINQETVPGSETTVTVDKPVLGPDGEWTKHTTDVKREWYAYNTPYSEKNELMEYSMDKHGTSVSLDMSKMSISEQAGLNPPKIDVQEVIKNHQAVWAMSLPGQEGHPILIPDGADGVFDGKLNLDPNDIDPTHVIQTPNGTIQLGEFAKILLNQPKLATLPDGNIATEYFTNIKGEYRLNVWQLNGGMEGKFGLISAGTLQTDEVGNQVFKSFATIRGAGPTPDTIGILVPKDIPPHTIDHMIPPPAVEFVPPDAPIAFDAPWIPTPFVPRNPLPPMRPTPEYPYYDFNSELFRRADSSPATLADIMRFRSDEVMRSGRLASLFPPRTGSRPVGGANTETRSTEEGELILRTIHDTFARSPHIYVALAGAIGDVAINSAYIQGLREYATRAGGATKKITLIAPANVVPLITPLAEKFNCNIITEERYKGATKAQELIESANEKDAIVLELDHHNGRPIVDLLPRGSLIINDLFAASVGLYDNNRSGNDRFSAFLGDLLSVPAAQQISIHSQTILPANAGAIFDELKTRYSIDTTKKQVALIIEASHQMKRYSLDQWKTVLEKIAAAQPNTEFNVIYNPNPGTASYPEAELQRIFGGVANARLVSGDLTQQMVLLSHQNLVLSNDTGLAHVAATLDNGPRVISLHVPSFPPNVWITNSQRHTGILPPQDRLTGNFDTNETDETKKWINKIDPNDIAARSVDILNSQPGPTPDMPPPGTEGPVTLDENRPLIEQVNEKLTTTTKDTSSFEVKAGALSSYIKSIPLPKNAKVDTFTPTFVNGTIQARGSISVPIMGTAAQFTVVLENDPAGGVRVTSHTLNLSGFAQGFRTSIESQINNLNQLITDRINKQINQAWETSSLKIDGDKLMLGVKKK